MSDGAKFGSTREELQTLVDRCREIEAESGRGFPKEEGDLIVRKVVAIHRLQSGLKREDKSFAESYLLSKLYCMLNIDSQRRFVEMIEAEAAEYPEPTDLRDEDDDGD